MGPVFLLGIVAIVISVLSVIVSVLNPKTAKGKIGWVSIFIFLGFLSAFLLYRQQKEVEVEQGHTQEALGHFVVSLGLLPTQIIKASSTGIINAKDIYLGIITDRSTVQAVQTSKVHCKPPENRRKLEPSSTLISIYPAKEQANVNLWFFVGNDSEVLALENATVNITFNARNLKIGAGGYWQITQTNKSAVFVSSQPFNGGTCSDLFGALQILFPRAGRYLVSTTITAKGMRGKNLNFYIVVLETT